METPKRPIGRPRRFARFEEFEAALPGDMKKRPVYCDKIGIFKGADATSVWVKIRLPRGGMYRGRSIKAGGTVEHKLGNRASWDWPQLIEERDRLQGLADRGEPLEAVEVETFATYADDWLKRRKPTLKSYGVTKGNIAALSTTFGKKTLDAITVSDVNRWIGKQSEKLKPSSVQRQLNIFNAVMNDAVSSGIIGSNPSAKADKIRGAEARLRYVTDEEWETILKTADEIEQKQEEDKKRTPRRIRGWLRYFATWAYHSGMRRSEILNLTWNDIKEIDDETTIVEIRHTKTGKPRSIACTEEMKSIIIELQKLERAEGDNRLFPVSLTTAKRALTHLWKKTGLENVRLHDLRSTHASKLIHNNVDVRTVAGRLGHSGTGMLSKHYAVDLGDIAAAKRFEATLAKPRKAKNNDPDDSERPASANIQKKRKSGGNSGTNPPEKRSQPESPAWPNIPVGRAYD
jgi:integrase